MRNCVLGQSLGVLAASRLRLSPKSSFARLPNRFELSGRLSGGMAEKIRTNRLDPTYGLSVANRIRLPLRKFGVPGIGTHDAGASGIADNNKVSVECPLR